MVITAVFAVIYASITFVNHYLFRTAALDYGMFTHALWDYAHFRSHDTTLLIDSPPTPFLSIHFSLLPMLISPLYWAFGSYTLLIVQWLAILAGGWGIYAYVRHRTSIDWLPLLMMLHFFLLWGIYSALAFDYHDNVVAAMLVPWLLHFFERKRWAPAMLFLVLLLVSKENMALWAVFILLGLLVKHFLSRQIRWMSLATAVLSIGFFLFVTQVWMPSLEATQRGFTQMNRYEHFGDSYGSIITNLLTQPRLIYEALFMNITGDTTFDGIKTELYLVLLFSGAWALLVRPWYLLMAVPIFAQKLLANDPTFWGINYQYSIEFAPLLCLAVFETILLLKKRKNRQRLALAVLALTFLTTGSTLINRKSKWYQEDLAQFFNPAHYRSLYNLEQFRQALKLIPDEVPVSANTYLTPRLVNRELLYHYPVMGEAEYVAVVKPREPMWALIAEQYKKQTEELYASPDFEIIYEDDQLVIFRKKGNGGAESAS